MLIPKSLRPLIGKRLIRNLTEEDLERLKDRMDDYAFNSFVFGLIIGAILGMVLMLF